MVSEHAAAACLGQCRDDHGVNASLSAAMAVEANLEALFIIEHDPPPPPIHRARISGGIGYARMAATAEANWVAEERERHAQDARGRFRSGLCGQRRSASVPQTKTSAPCQQHRGVRSRAHT